MRKVIGSFHCFAKLDEAQRFRRKVRLTDNILAFGR
jgi:hypothetical protein